MASVDVIDYSRKDLIIFNVGLVQVLTTVTVFIFVPSRASHAQAYYIEGRNGSFRNAMILLLVTNLVVFIGELSEIFTSKKTLAFGGFKRVATLIASLPLFIATAVFTATLPGKEIVWEFWLTISLAVSGF